MKLPITDQFLLDVYDNILKKADDAADFILSSPRRQSFLLFSSNPMIGNYRRKMRKNQFNKLVYHLKKHHYIEAKNLQKKKGIMLTKEGINKAIRARFKIDNSLRKKREDGKWIMIIFDIPRNHYRARNMMRNVLVSLGYKIFQQSVWVTPYDVHDKTEKLLQFHSLDNYVRLFLIEELN